MTINFAVERLYETGWLPDEEMQLERLPNGLRYPSVESVVAHFKRAGLELAIRPHLMFGCCRAEWRAAFDEPGSEFLNGTVVGSCDREAAVYALAKLREQQADQRLTARQNQSALAVV